MNLRDVDIDQAITTVRELAVTCENLRGQLSAPYTDGRELYMNWCETCELRLSNILADPELSRSVYSERYWRIAEVAVVDRQSQVILAEIRVQTDRLNNLLQQLEGYLHLRSRSGTPTIIDTNVLLHYQRVDKVNWKEVTRQPHTRLVIPLIVLDELDGKRYLGSDKIRARARSAIEPLDQLHEDLGKAGFAALPDGTTIEYLTEERDHQRLSNPDEEILDRAEFLHRVTKTPVVIVTADRGMRVRANARGGGLRTILMPASYARDQEPPDLTSDAR